jgi:hypothetical protein
MTASPAEDREEERTKPKPAAKVKSLDQELEELEVESTKGGQVSQGNV